jgi:hypothetical protein
VESHRSDLRTVVSLALVAYAACDMIHEALGHGVACALIPGVRALSISTVALQTSSESRWVAAAGSVANVLAGALLLALAPRARAVTNRYFVWLLGALNLMNGTGYLFFSGITDTGDWSVVVAGWKPEWVWRAGLVAVGAWCYARAVSLSAVRLARIFPAVASDPGEARRLTLPAYLAGGFLLVAGAAMNPIGPQLIWLSGLSSGFGAMAGLLLVPRLVGKQSSVGSPEAAPIRFSPATIAAAVVTASVFVLILGKGIPVPPR